MNVTLEYGRQLLRSDRSSVCFFKVGSQWHISATKGKGQSQNDALKEQGNEWRELVNTLLDNARRHRVQLTVLVGRLRDETLNHGDKDGIKATNQLTVDLQIG